MNKKLEDSIKTTLALMSEAGLSSSNLKIHRCYFRRIMNYYIEAGYAEYSEDLMKHFILNQKIRCSRNEISLHYYTCLRRAANILIDVHNTGIFQWRSYTSGHKYKVNPYFRSCIDSFLSKQSYSKSTIRHHDARIRRFLHFLESKGKIDFSVVGPKDLIDFLAYIYPHHKGDMGHTVHSLRIFISFLVENNIITDKMLSVPLQKPAPSHKKVPACFTHEEFTLILSQIDRTATIGKRDYAALLLASNAGLRASDIVNMKLKHIDWKNEIIRIVQKKTGDSLILPLEPAVGNALVDYILYARYDSDSDYVFVRDVAPYTALSDPRAIGCIIKKYMEKAKMPFETGDGKTFHGLRRSIGTWMLESDIPLDTISQVLGHASINSTKAYLSMDEKKLYECSLDLELINVESGVYA